MKLLLSILFFSSVLNASTVIGVITNTTEAAYSIGTIKVQQISIPVKLNVVQTEEKVEFIKIDSASRSTPETTINDKTKFLPTEKYGFYDLAVIRVTDGDRNVNGHIKEEVQVTLNSDNGDMETLVLTETTVNSGIFIGTIGIDNEKIVGNNNVLNTKLGEYIRTTYTDFYTRSATAKIVYPENLQILVQKSVDKTTASVGDLVKYSIKVVNEEKFRVDGLFLFDLIPYGIKPIEGTFLLDEEKFEPIISKDGKVMSYEMEPFKPKTKITMEFYAQIGAGVLGRKVTNKAYVANEPYFTSNISEATTRITTDFMEDRSLVLGQVYECNNVEGKKGRGVAGVKLYFEEGTYSITDDRGFYHVEGLERGTHVVQIDEAILPRGYKVGRIKDLKNGYNSAGTDSSKFVEVSTAILKTVDFCLDKMDKKELKNVDVKTDRKIKKTTYQEGIPEFNSETFKNIQGKKEIIWPANNYVPTVASTSVLIAHKRIESTVVWLNGEKVNLMSYDGKEMERGKDTVVSVWKGLDLKPDDNEIKVEILNRYKKVIKTITRNVHVTSTAANAEFIEDESTLVADGINSPVIAVKLTDKDGYELRPGMMGEYKISSPYFPNEYKTNTSANKDLKEKTVMTEGKYQVEANGVAYIILKPTTVVDKVLLKITLENKTKMIETKLSPNLRDWIMVGFAEGTVGYNTLKGHQEFIDAKSKDKYGDGRASFFAKGRIKGEWLMTIRYDTGREKDRTTLFDKIDPEAYYTVYNDNSVQGNDSQSREKLYVKVEKKDFYVLFGDYKTDLDVTQLSTYKRSMTGIKLEYQTKNMSSVNFIAETEQIFARDELRGDGTSGYYYFKNKEVIPNSEKIVIQVRDRYREEIILEEIEKTRYVDYDINYLSGSIFFKSPIMSTDKGLNPRYIIATYEIPGDGQKKYVMGGRSSFRPDSQNVEVGTTYLFEDTVKEFKTLNGVDMTVNITDNLELKAEYARSNKNEDDKDLGGTAKSAKLEYFASKKTQVATYYREQSKNFGLGQTTESLNNKRKVGFDTKHEVLDTIEIGSTIYRDTNLEDDSYLDVMEMKGTKKGDTYDYFLGYRSTKSTEIELNNQVLVGGSKTFFDKKLKLMASYDYSLDDNESQRYPTKATVGTEVKMTESSEFFATYEWTEKDNLFDLARVGVRYNPWEGMKLENGTSSQKDENGTVIYNAVSANQSHKFNDYVTGDIGYEKGTNILNEDNITEVSDKEYSVYRLGLGFDNKEVGAKIATEYRNTLLEDKLNLSTSIFTMLNSDFAYGLSSIYSNIKGGLVDSSDLTFALSVAFRPEMTNLIVLEKMEFINQEKGVEKTEKLINNMAVNYMYDDYLETSFQYGIKNTVNKTEVFEHNGITQFAGIDFDYYFDNKWMLGNQASVLYAHSANNYSYSYGISIGHNVYKDSLIKIGYNMAGFNDNDFSLQNYYYKGPYLQFKTKFNHNNIKDVIRDLL